MSNETRFQKIGKFLVCMFKWSVHVDFQFLFIERKLENIKVQQSLQNRFSENRQWFFLSFGSGLQVKQLALMCAKKGLEF